METLGALTEDIRFKIHRDCAMSRIKSNIVSTDWRRFIEGIAISSHERNANGAAFLARGVTLSFPIPLIWEHDFNTPLGEVIAVEARGNALWFKAELANSGRLDCAEQAWLALIERRTTSISVLGRNLAAQARKDGTYNGTFADWSLEELSLAETGADRGARVQRIYETTSVVSLTRPSRVVHWEAP